MYQVRINDFGRYSAGYDVIVGQAGMNKIYARGGYGSSLIKILKRLLILLLGLLLPVYGYAASERPTPGELWSRGKITTEELWKLSEPNPHPPIPSVGSYVVGYTVDFAKQHNLPVENVIGDLPVGVPYMELEVTKYPESDYKMCFASFLVKRPNDYSFYINNFKYYKSEAPKFHQQLIDNLAKLKVLNVKNLKPKPTTSFSTTLLDNQSPDPNMRVAGMTSIGFFQEDVIENYDFVSVEYNCAMAQSKFSRNTWNIGMRVSKASVWGRYITNFPSLSINDPHRPKPETIRFTFIYVVYPESLLKKLWLRK